MNNSEENIIKAKVILEPIVTKVLSDKKECATLVCSGEYITKEIKVDDDNYQISIRFIYEDKAKGIIRMFANIYGPIKTKKIWNLSRYIDSPTYSETKLINLNEQRR